MPLLSEEVVTFCFGVIERVWPRGLDELESIPERNRFYKVMGLCHTAVVISMVERLDNFDEVLARFCNNEPAAYSEMYVASRFVREGFGVRFAPDIGKRKPDLEIDVGDGSRVIVEIVTPMFSDDLKDVIDLADNFFDRCEPLFDRRRIEVDFIAEPGESDYNHIEAALATLPVSSTCHLDGIARIVDVSSAGVLEDMHRGVTAPLALGGRPLNLSLGRVAPSFEGSCRLRVPIDVDRRIPRFMDRKVRQLSKDDHNIVVMDVTHTPFTLAREWHAIMTRHMKPTINTRVGGVARLECGMKQDGIGLELWTFIRNPYASRPLPRAVISMFERIAKDDHLYASRSVGQHGFMPPPKPPDELT